MRLTTLAAAFAIAGLSGNALAATATGSFNVNATVNAVCQVLNANDLAFGAYDPLAAGNKTASTTFEVRCTKNAGNFIALSQGANGNAVTCLGRQMNGPGTDKLNYRLLNGAVDWGCDAAGRKAYTAAVNSPVVQTINGEIAAGQFVQAGAYTDAITITVDF